MVKPRSQQASKKKVDPKVAEALADSLADKPYGKPQPVEEVIERLTIALPVSLYDDLEKLAKARKRAKAGNRSMSAIAREAIREYLRKHNS